MIRIFKAIILCGFFLGIAVVPQGCTEGETEETWECQVVEAAPAFIKQVGCKADYDVVSARPLSTNLPGTFSGKTVIDRYYENAHYFQNSNLYQTHYQFASENLSAQNGMAIVPQLAEFNRTEYYSPDRRFLLGALNYYEGPGIWTYEIAPYDTASVEMVEQAIRIIQANGFFGVELTFHPTSDGVAKVAELLPPDIRVVTSDDLYEGIDYQPLNLGTSMGLLRFLTTEDLEAGNVYYRDIAVLDAIPNDIPVVMGIITAEFQTPLSHINVLSQNRGTPNMAFREAFTNEAFRALEGKWVQLVVSPFEMSLTEVTQAQADAWWEANKPDPIGVPPLDTTVTDLRNIEDILDLANKELGACLAESIPAFGGKASHYGAFPHMNPEKVPFPKAFAIPVVYYRQFMEENGLFERVAAMMLADDFINSPIVRKARLEELQADMQTLPVDETFLQMVEDKLNAEYPGIRTRFRSSTNCEDLDGFTGAGLYTSKSGDPNDEDYPIADAIRTVWASVWNFRAFDERAYRSIDHDAVGMAVLVHRSFPEEEANGVAVTSNLFDPLGIEPGYYVNVQLGDFSVVIPPEGITTDQFVYHYEMQGQPIVFLGHSNLVPEGSSVLTRAQTAKLGAALYEIHAFFNKLYGPWTVDHFYAMDIEFKFDGEPGQEPALFIKQARPYPGWGLVGK